MIQAVLGDRYRLGERIADGGMTRTGMVLGSANYVAPVPDPRQDRPDLPVPAAALIRHALATMRVPGAPEPHPLIPDWEGSPTGEAGAPVVHTPHPAGRPPLIQTVVHSSRRPRRRGWRWRGSS